MASPRGRWQPCPLVTEKFDDEGGNEIFFAGVGLGDEESERREGAVADFGFTAGGEVLIIDGEEHDKKERADAFVAVIEWVIFDNEIEEMGSFFGNGGIELFPVVTLINSIERTGKATTARFAK